MGLEPGGGLWSMPLHTNVRPLVAEQVLGVRLRCCCGAWKGSALFFFVSNNLMIVKGLLHKRIFLGERNLQKKEKIWYICTL